MVELLVKLVKRGNLSSPIMDSKGVNEDEISRRLNVSILL